MAQYQSFSVFNDGTFNMYTKVTDGPFFVTDVYSGYSNGPTTLTTVPNGDCGVAQDKHTVVLVVTTGAGNSYIPQLHGIRMPVLPGRTLCASNVPAALGPVTVMGFRPY